MKLSITEEVRSEFLKVIDGYDIGEGIGFSAAGCCVYGQVKDLDKAGLLAIEIPSGLTVFITSNPDMMTFDPFYEDDPFSKEECVQQAHDDPCGCETCETDTADTRTDYHKAIDLAKAIVQSGKVAEVKLTIGRLTDYCDVQYPTNYREVPYTPDQTKRFMFGSLLECVQQAHDELLGVKGFEDAIKTLRIGDDYSFVDKSGIVRHGKVIALFEDQIDIQSESSGRWTQVKG